MLISALSEWQLQRALLIRRLKELFKDIDGNMDVIKAEIGEIDSLVQLEPGVSSTWPLWSMGISLHLTDRVQYVSPLCCVYPSWLLSRCIIRLHYFLGLFLRQFVFQGGLRYTDQLRFFENKKHKFLWDRKSQSFMRLHGLDHNTQCSNIMKQRQVRRKIPRQNIRESLFGNVFHRWEAHPFRSFQGLSLKEETVRRVLYGNNLIDVEVQGIITILMTEVLEPFYVFQVFSMIIWLVTLVMFMLKRWNFISRDGVLRIGFPGFFPNAMKKCPFNRPACFAFPPSSYHACEFSKLSFRSFSFFRFMDEYYWYAGAIIIISVFSLCLGVRQIYKNQRALRDTAIGQASFVESLSLWSWSFATRIEIPLSKPSERFQIQ